VGSIPITRSNAQMTKDPLKGSFLLHLRDIALVFFFHHGGDNEHGQIASERTLPFGHDLFLPT
jgi:hypothetical protein